MVEVRATGAIGGCDEGALPSWGGRLSVTTDDEIVSTPPPGGGTGAPNSPDDCKHGGWQSFTGPAFKNQGQCVSFAVHAARAG